MAISECINNILKTVPDNVKLITVTKTRTVEEIKEAYDSGARDFGENKVQELIKKIDSFGSDVHWHLIGHLQRNKVKYIVGKVELIHSLDSIELLYEIEKQYKKANKICNALIQINIGNEPTKTGLDYNNLEELIQEVEKCNYIKVVGLMATIPQGGEESCRYYFRKMKSIWDELKTRNYKNISMDILSMGMTSDYKWAVEEGSNMIRIGEGIFGKRIYNNK